jgi:hypothetical protein
MAACRSREDLAPDSERDVEEGSSWLASKGTKAEDVGNHHLANDPFELLAGGLPNHHRLAGGDRDSDRRLSDQIRKAKTA